MYQPRMRTINCCAVDVDMTSLDLRLVFGVALVALWSSMQLETAHLPIAAISYRSLAR